VGTARSTWDTASTPASATAWACGYAVSHCQSTLSAGISKDLVELGKKHHHQSLDLVLIAGGFFAQLGIVNLRIIVEFIIRNSGEKWGTGPKSSQKKAL